MDGFPNFGISFSYIISMKQWNSSMIAKPIFFSHPISVFMVCCHCFFSWQESQLCITSSVATQLRKIWKVKRVNVGWCFWLLMLFIGIPGKTQKHSPAQMFQIIFGSGIFLLLNHMLLVPESSLAGFSGRWKPLFAQNSTPKKSRTMGP